MQCANGVNPTPPSRGGGFRCRATISQHRDQTHQQVSSNSKLEVKLMCRLIFVHRRQRQGGLILLSRCRRSSLPGYQGDLSPAQPSLLLTEQASRSASSATRRARRLRHRQRHAEGFTRNAAARAADGLGDNASESVSPHPSTPLASG